MTFFFVSWEIGNVSLDFFFRFLHHFLLVPWLNMTKIWFCILFSQSSTVFWEEWYSFSIVQPMKKWDRNLCLSKVNCVAEKIRNRYRYIWWPSNGVGEPIISFSIKHKRSSFNFSFWSFHPIIHSGKKSTNSLSLEKTFLVHFCHAAC